MQGNPGSCEEGYAASDASASRLAFFDQLEKLASRSSRIRSTGSGSPLTMPSKKTRSW